MTTDPFKSVTRTVPYWEYPEQKSAERIVVASHVEALWAIGEPTIIFLMWKAVDYDNGLVQHCPACWDNNRHSQAWSQSERNECPECFGTGFEGGFRARLIRPTIISDRNSDDRYTNRGELETDDVTLETTTDFHSRRGDIMVRADNSRFKMEEMNEVVLRSGFGIAQREESISGTVQHAHLLPPGDIAYKMPPTQDAQVRAILEAAAVGQHLAPDLSAYEIIRGPLIPGDD